MANCLQINKIREFAGGTVLGLNRFQSQRGSQGGGVDGIYFSAARFLQKPF